MTHGAVSQLTRWLIEASRMQMKWGVEWISIRCLVRRKPVTRRALFRKTTSKSEMAILSRDRYIRDNQDSQRAEKDGGRTDSARKTH